MKIPKIEVRRRERQIWKLKTEKGWTDERIANHLKITPRTVRQYHQRMTKRYAQETIEDIQAVKGEQVARLEALYMEAIEEWNRSRQNKAKTVQRTRTLPRSQGGQYASVKPAVETEATVEGRLGDVSYLNTAINILAEIRKITGADAPITSFNFDLSNLSMDQLSRIIKGDNIFSVVLEKDPRQDDADDIIVEVPEPPKQLVVELDADEYEIL